MSNCPFNLFQWLRHSLECTGIGYACIGDSGKLFRLRGLLENGATTKGVTKLRKRWVPDDKLRIGLFWPYSRTLLPSEEIARRNPDLLDLANHTGLAQQIERLGFDFTLVADGYAPASEENSRIGFQDPSTMALLLAPYLLQATTTLGVLSTLHTSYLHPVFIARAAAQLDFLSGGRWGWNIVNGFRGHEAKLFGKDKLPDDGGYGMSDEALNIILDLWAGKSLDHHGACFNVEGKIRSPLPAETPLLVSAASSERGRQFAGKYCHYLFATPVSIEDVDEMAKDLQKSSEEAGREHRTQVLMLSDIFIRDEPGRAREEYDELIASSDPEALKAWSKHLSQQKFRGKRPEDIFGFIGTPDEIAEQMIEMHRSGSLTGILCRFPIWQPEEIERFGSVIKKLESAGVWSSPESRGYSW